MDHQRRKKLIILARLEHKKSLARSRALLIAELAMTAADLHAIQAQPIPRFATGGQLPAPLPDPAGSPGGIRIDGMQFSVARCIYQAGQHQRDPVQSEQLARLERNEAIVGRIVDAAAQMNAAFRKMAEKAQELTTALSSVSARNRRHHHRKPRRRSKK